MSHRPTLYLDQNYISRIAKFTLGQSHHEDFGQLYERLQGSSWLCPASSFHALETEGSYLLPTVQAILEELSHGYSVRPWQEILQHQRTHQTLDLSDILTQEPQWEKPVDVEQLAPLLEVPLEGHLNRRIRTMQQEVRRVLGMLDEETMPPFADLLARLVAFRSRNGERQLLPSDFIDIVMAASLAPYPLHLATDSFVRESLDRLGWGENVYSGKKAGVQELCHIIQGSQR